MVLLILASPCLQNNGALKCPLYYTNRSPVYLFRVGQILTTSPTKNLDLVYIRNTIFMIRKYITLVLLDLLQIC